MIISLYDVIIRYILYMSVFCILLCVCCFSFGALVKMCSEMPKNLSLEVVITQISSAGEDKGRPRNETLIFTGKGMT